MKEHNGTGNHMFGSKIKPFCITGTGEVFDRVQVSIQMYANQPEQGQQDSGLSGVEVF
jgi:hypothetical protein